MELMGRFLKGLSRDVVLVEQSFRNLECQFFIWISGRLVRVVFRVYYVYGFYFVGVVGGLERLFGLRLYIQGSVWFRIQSFSL